MYNISLSPHFELKEFTASATAREHGIDNTPPPEAVENLRALCIHTLEPLRMALGLPIIITSGYRTKQLNHLLTYHSVKSQHMEGEAADFYVGQSQVSGSKFQVPSETDGPGSKFQVSGGGDAPGSKIATSFSLSARDPFGVQVSGPKGLVSGSKNLVQEIKSSRFKVQSYLNHQTGDSLMKLETGDSPMKLGTGDSPMKLGTGDSPMEHETPRQRLIRAFRQIITDDRITFDQCIIYPTFIHVSHVRYGKNRRKLTRGFGNGTYAALTRAQALALE